MAQIEPLVGEKFDKESNSAVLACNDWLRLGPGRSIPKLLDSYQRKSRAINNFEAPSQSYPTLTTWSSRFKWPERAQLFDASYEERTNQERNAEISAGLALDFERLRELKQLYDLLNDQLYQRDEDGNLINLWVADVKQIGSGKDAEQVDIERFNSSLITQIRGVLDDIAKEVGGRVAKSESNTKLSGELDITHSVDPEQYNRTIGALANALGIDVSRASDQREGQMDTAEP